MTTTCFEFAGRHRVPDSFVILVVLRAWLPVAMAFIRPGLGTCSWPRTLLTLSVLVPHPCWFFVRGCSSAASGRRHPCRRPSPQYSRSWFAPSRAFSLSDAGSLVRLHVLWPFGLRIRIAAHRPPASPLNERVIGVQSRPPAPPLKVRVVPGQSRPGALPGPAPVLLRASAPPLAPVALAYSARLGCGLRSARWAGLRSSLSDAPTGPQTRMRPGAGRRTWLYSPQGGFPRRLGCFAHVSGRLRSGHGPCFAGHRGGAGQGGGGDSAAAWGGQASPVRPRIACGPQSRPARSGGFAARICGGSAAAALLRARSTFKRATTGLQRPFLARISKTPAPVTIAAYAS